MSLKLWIIFVAFFLLSTVLVVKGLEEDYDYRDAYGDHDDGDDDDDDDECPKIDLPPTLGGRCHVSDYCSKITCQASVQDKHATIIFHVNRCDKPLTATVTIKSSGFAVDWSHTFKDGDIVKLPADSGRMRSIGKVSVSLKVGLKKEGKKLHFKSPRVFWSATKRHLGSGNEIGFITRLTGINDYDLYTTPLKHQKLELMGDANASFLRSLDRPFDATLLDGEIPLSSKYCGFSAWYNKQPRYVKMLTIAGPILAIIVLFLITACCCMCCKRRSPARLQVNLPSHRLQISSTKSKVPMQRLVNEE